MLYIIIIYISLKLSQTLDLTLLIILKVTICICPKASAHTVSPWNDLRASLLALQLQLLCTVNPFNTLKFQLRWPLFMGAFLEPLHRALGSTKASVSLWVIFVSFILRPVARRSCSWFQASCLCLTMFRRRKENSLLEAI